MALRERAAFRSLSWRLGMFHQWDVVLLVVQQVKDKLGRGTPTRKMPSAELRVRVANRCRPCPLSSVGPPAPGFSTSRCQAPRISVSRCTWSVALVLVLGSRACGFLRRLAQARWVCPPEGKAGALKR